MGIVFVAEIGAGARAVVCSIDCVHQISCRLQDAGRLPPTWDEFESKTHLRYCAHCFNCGEILSTPEPPNRCAIHDGACPPSDWVQGFNAREFALAFVKLTGWTQIADEFWSCSENLSRWDERLNGCELAEMVSRLDGEW
jgi:hypothetical protein